MLIHNLCLTQYEYISKYTINLITVLVTKYVLPVTPHDDQKMPAKAAGAASYLHLTNNGLIHLI